MNRNVKRKTSKRGTWRVSFRDDDGDGGGKENCNGVGMIAKRKMVWEVLMAVILIMTFMGCGLN